MNSEFQDRKDIDKLFHDLYRVDGQTANVVKYDEQSKFIDEDGTPKTIDEILSSYYDIGEVDEKITNAIIGGDIDLTDYVKRVDLVDKTKYDIDLNLNFGLRGLDDSIVIDMDIVDYIVNKTIYANGNGD